MAIFFLSQTTIEGKHFPSFKVHEHGMLLQIYQEEFISILPFYSAQCLSAACLVFTTVCCNQPAPALRRKLLKCVNAAQRWCAAPVLRRKLFLIMFPATKLDSNDEKLLIYP